MKKKDVVVFVAGVVTGATWIISEVLREKMLVSHDFDGGTSINWRWGRPKKVDRS